MSNQVTAVPAMPVVPGVDHRFVELSDGRIHTAIAGAGEPVLLLSGFAQTWWEWRDVMPALAERYRVLAPDLRGEGWSDLPAGRMTRTTRLTDVLELLDALGIERVRLVTHDMGAITGFQLAMAHPDRVVSQVMLSVPPPQMRFSADMLPGMRYLWFEEALAVPGLGPFLLRGERLPRWLFSRFAAHPLPADVVDLYVALMREPVRARAGSILCRRLVLPELVRIMRGSYRDSRFEMPTLIVFGTGDIAFPARIARKLFADSTRFGPAVTLEFVEGAAHFLADEQPDAVAEHVIRFFG